MDLFGEVLLNRFTLLRNDPVEITKANALSESQIQGLMDHLHPLQEAC